MADARTHEIKASHMSLYPTHDSLIDAVAYIEAHAPIDRHDVFPLLMQYHNTLIQEISEHMERDRDQPPGKPHLTRIK